MIKIIKYGQNFNLNNLLKRNENGKSGVTDIVRSIIENVRENGDKALFEYSEKFDKAKLLSLEVTNDEIDEAYNRTSPYLVETLEMAKRNIAAFHERQVRQNFIINDTPGVILGQKITPVDRAGIYVPGGTAAYPSTVLMDAVPAKIAGVGEIYMTTPPRVDGSVSPEILTSAKIAGINRIFKVGGAQAIAALSYGTESIPKVDKIVGPGNIYVATAKMLCFGQVGIDMIAGPSEILIIADETASVKNVAADMLSQAEHDRLASSLLITTSEKLAQEVKNQIEIQVESLKRRDIASESIRNNGIIIIVETVEKAAEISNEIAPEHLELCVNDPFSLLSLIKHAGSIFMGHNTPEALGDYFAGPNHTLPTSGTARFSSPLSVDDFTKKSSFIYYTKPALEKVRERLIDFAENEGLDAHAKSVGIRFREKFGEELE